MGLYYDPDNVDFSACTWLGTIAGAMHNEYLTYWEQLNIRSESDTPEEQRRIFGRLVDVASAIRPTLHSLAANKRLTESVGALLTELGAKTEVDGDFAVEVAKALRAYPIVDHGIQITLAQEAADELLSGAETRFGDLVELIASRNLSERAAAYLDRATRLYLWGFEPETVVMCAAVLEAAYEGRFSDLDMFQLQITREGNHFEAFQYEQAAVVSKVYSAKDRGLARSLRDARNDVVHAVPAVAMSAKEALQLTAVLLGRLFPT